MARVRRVEVLADRPQVVDRLGLVDHVELATLVQQQDTWEIGSRRAPKRLLDFRTPLATARTLP